MVAPAEKSLAGLKHLKSKRYRYMGAVFQGMGLVLLFGQPGWSHGAIATVTRTFAVEASYSSGEPMALAQVVVYSPENPDQPWTTGQTNEAGEFEFSPDAAGNWDVVIRQAGHGATVSVPVATTAVAQGDQQSPAATLISSSEPLASSPLQRWASAGAALWGLVGTVLFFSRGKQS
ncbi:MAG: carboxypeptidase-like regulatory domain-containing protein [Leptolyngbyaceae cyanobacterium]